MEKKEEKNKKQALNLEELDKVSGGIMMVAKDGSGIKKYTCPECSEIFFFKKEANEHCKSVHGYKEDFFP